MCFNRKEYVFLEYILVFGVYFFQMLPAVHDYLYNIALF